VGSRTHRGVHFLYIDKENEQKEIRSIHKPVYKAYRFPHLSLKTGLLRNSHKQHAQTATADNSLLLTRSSACSNGRGKSKPIRSDIFCLLILTYDLRLTTFLLTLTLTHPPIWASRGRSNIIGAFCEDVWASAFLASSAAAENIATDEGTLMPFMRACLAGRLSFR